MKVDEKKVEEKKPERTTGRGMIGNYLHSLSPEEFAAHQRAAAKASAAACHKKKGMREMARNILDLNLSDKDEICAALAERGFDKGDRTEAAAVLLAQLNKARAGDTDAARFLRDTSGQKPVENVAVGNMDDKPFESLDLTKLTPEQLQALANEAEDSE